MTNHSITSVEGCLSAHWTHHSGSTGATAILFPDGAFAGYAVPGQSACTRQLTAMSVGHVADRVHGFSLSGGSGFGLAAADGVMQNLVERGIGFDAGNGQLIPIVPAASLFDGSTTPPDADAGYQAAASANSSPLPEGRVGAGAGARVGPGRRPAGMGTWAMSRADHVVAACTAVNAFGHVRDPENGRWVFGPPPREFGSEGKATDWSRHTTISVIVTDFPLDRVQLNIISQMAVAALARTISPAFAQFDGDVILAASTASRDDRKQASTIDVLEIGIVATDCLTQAILRAVTLGGPSLGGEADPTAK